MVFDFKMKNFSYDANKINHRIVAKRFDWIDRMVAEIRSLPLENFDGFTSENRNVWTCESCLRRALEALLDLGRHILAKGFGVGVSEYKEIAEELIRVSVSVSRGKHTA